MTDLTDTGTYSQWDWDKDVTAQRAFAANMGKYVAIGGETCHLGGIATTWNDCDNTLVQLAEFGWDFLNIQFWLDMLNKWRSQGCFPEVSRRLGYRLSLVSASAPDTVHPSSAMDMTIRMANSGFGKVFNQRPLKIVFRSEARESSVVVTTDARRSLPLAGETVDLSLSFTAPADLVPGDAYGLWLELPDPTSDATMAADPRYKIRLANVGVWDSVNGRNDLNMSVNVVA